MAFVRDNAIALAEGRVRVHAVVARSHSAHLRRSDRLSRSKTCWRPPPLAGRWACRPSRFAWASNRSRRKWTKCPARFNVFEIAGATVIVDYGHNPSSLAAILTAIEPFPQQMRTAVYSVAGDRRDCDIIRQGELLGGAFDRVILYEDQYLRGRPAGEIIGLLRAGLASARRTKEMQAFTTWASAADAALRLVSARRTAACAGGRRRRRR